MPEEFSPPQMAINISLTVISILVSRHSRRGDVSAIKICSVYGHRLRSLDMTLCSFEFCACACMQVYMYV